MIVWLALLLILVGLGLSFRANTRRGKRFVRAYLFLSLLEDGGSVQEANALAAKFGSKYDPPERQNFAIREAKRFADDRFGGKQIPVIELARSKGFTG